MNTLQQINARLDYIASLDHGWLNGDGERVGVVVLDLARRVLTELVALQFPYKIYLYPTPCGDIQAESSFTNRVDFEFEFTKYGKILCLGSTKDEVFVERAIDSGTPAEMAREIDRWVRTDVAGRSAI